MRFSQHPLALVWIPLLYGLQSIPGTGALRTLFLLWGGVHLVLLVKAPAMEPSWAPLGGIVRSPPAYLLAFLTLWLFCASLFLAHAPNAGSEFFAEWGKTLLMLALGASIARLWPRPGEIVLALFFGAFLHVLATLGLQLQSWLASGRPAWGMSWLGNYGYASPFVTVASAWLLADLLARSRQKQLFPWSWGVSAGLLALALTAEVFLRAKAGQVMTLLLLLMTAFAATSAWPWRRRLVLLSVVAAVSLSVVMSARDRWQFALDDVHLALTTPADPRTLTGTDDPQAWINQIRHDPSIYLRATWAKMALAGVASHPWGLGYGGDAFGRWVKERWGIEGAVSSHSGWLDFLLANGLPGGLLLAAFAWALIRWGWHSWQSGHPFGLALIFFVLHYFFRGAIDGIFYGSRLTGAAFALGALWVLAYAHHPDQSANTFRRR